MANTDNGVYDIRPRMAGYLGLLRASPAALTHSEFLFFVGLVLLITVSSVGCSIQRWAANRDLSVAVAEARTACSDLPGDSMQLCERVVQRQLYGHAAYRKERRAAAKSVRATHAVLIEKASSARERCKQGEEEACNRVAALTREARATRTAHYTILNSQLATTANVYRAISGIATILAKHRVPAQVICRVRDIGRVDCTPLESLLASYDSEMGALILQDITRLYEVFDLNLDHRLLLGCAPGVWSAEELSILGIGEVTDVLAISDQAANDLTDKCAELNKVVSEMSPSPGGAPGFSGVTGFDPLGLISACGMSIGGNDMGDFVAKAMEMYENATEQCQASLAESMMSEPSSAEDEKAKNPPTKGEPDGPSEDATVEDETTEEGENEQGQRTTTTTTTYSDNTVVTANTNHVTGVTTVTVTYTDVPGASATMVIDPSNDSKTYSDSDDPGVTTTVYDSSPDYSYTKDGEGNSWVESPKYILYQNRWGEARWYDKSSDNVRCLHCTGQWATCVDETCGSCRDFAELMPGMTEGCLASGGASYSCGRFSEGADCCSNPSVYPADPRVLMPNPDGDFMCAGAMDPDVQAGVCQMRCSVAEHEDCESNCLSTTGLRVDFDLMDAVCRYAIWDACFSGPAIIMPEHGERSVGPPPIPTVGTVVLDHMLFPPGNYPPGGRLPVGWE